MTNTSKHGTVRLLLPLLLALSLIGCATTSPVTSVEPAKAPPPNAELMKQPRSLKASQAAQNDIKKWRETLNSTPSK